MSTTQLLRAVKQDNQDFEWYPTTNEIIQVVKNDLNKTFREYDGVKSYNILDIGAGDGRVLEALQNGKMYAIEKSKPLLNALDKSIYIIGTDFKQQTLIDKKVDVTFCNPPYSEYEEWAEKIIKESKSAYVYLVIPDRWVNSYNINNAIESRNGKVDVLGDFNFLDGDRQARANVHIVRIELGNLGYYKKDDARSSTDPFRIWFEENFKVGKENEEVDIFKATDKSSLENALVDGRDLVTTLQELYQHNLAKLMDTYQGLAKVDADILKELEISLDNVKESLRLKITGLKDLYWLELFNNLDKVTNKLCSKTRQKLLKDLTENTHVDFSASNAYAVVIWVIKNANQYFDDQLIDVVETMTDKANAVLYKSNERTFKDEHWRYCDNDDMKPCYYKLDYRIVIDRVGGIVDPDSYYYTRTKSGLRESGEDFLDDLRTIATNIGFDTSGQPSVKTQTWESGKKNNSYFLNHRTGEEEILFEAKAHKNGNIHLKLNQKFICKLNVEFGRLKGWLKSPKQASEELGIKFEDAVGSFNSNIKLDNNSVLQLEYTGI